MRKITIAAATFFLAGLAAAAEIHGTISEGGKPVPKGTAVKVDCSGAAASGTTDAYGSYTVKTSATGPCTLSLAYKGASPSIAITVYEKPSRYDFVVKSDGGKPTLARK